MIFAAFENEVLAALVGAGSEPAESRTPAAGPSVRVGVVACVTSSRNVRLALPQTWWLL